MKITSEFKSNELREMTGSSGQNRRLNNGQPQSFRLQMNRAMTRRLASKMRGPKTGPVNPSHLTSFVRADWGLKSDPFILLRMKSGAIRGA
jgi:hypothetical protein